MDKQAPARLPWPTLILLMAVFTVGNIDRALVSVLAEPIKREFLLSDSQLGLLTGLAFAIPYTLAGIPMGRLIDRSHRVRLVTGMMIVWSGLTAGFAFLQSYAAMIAARMALGASEAGQAPALTALASDLAPPEKRGRAIGLLYLSTPLGIIIGFAFGSLVAAHHGWRTAFLVAAAPGFILAAAMWVLVREPVRGGADTDDGAAPMPKGSSGPIFRGDPFPVLLVAACGLAVAGQVGISAFLAPFLVRVHGVDIGQAGLLIAATYGVGGLIGIAGGGAIGDWLAKRTGNGDLIGVAVFNVGAAGFAILATTLASLAAALAALALYAVLCVAYYGPVIGAYVSRLPADRRGVGMAVLMIVMNLVGYGLGPQIAGSLSDLFARLGFESSLRPALSTTACLYCASAVLLLAACRYRHRGPETA